MWPLLLGVNLGPLLLLTGSLAGLLWQAGARRAGVEIDARALHPGGGGRRAARDGRRAALVLRVARVTGARIRIERHGEWRENGRVHAAAVRFDLHIPQSRSLKAKRAAIRPIVDGLRHRFHVSVAEVDHQDQWQRARDRRRGRREHRLRSCARCSPRSSGSSSPRADVELLDVETAWLESERA